MKCVTLTKVCEQHVEHRVSGPSLFTATVTEQSVWYRKWPPGGNKTLMLSVLLLLPNARLQLNGSQVRLLPSERPHVRVET